MLSAHLTYFTPFAPQPACQTAVQKPRPGVSLLAAAPFSAENGGFPARLHQEAGWGEGVLKGCDGGGGGAGGDTSAGEERRTADEDGQGGGG